MKKIIINTGIFSLMVLSWTILTILILSAIISQEMNTTIVYWGDAVISEGRLIYHPTWYFYAICILIGSGMSTSVMLSLKRWK